MSLTESAEKDEDRSSVSAEQLALQLLDEEDQRFVDALRGVGLLGDLTPEILLAIASELEENERETRQVELLELYYEPSTDPVRSARIQKDRFFRQRLGDPATAAGLVARLAALAPELSGVDLERIGGTEDGPLVVRAGEHFAAVIDDYDDDEPGDGKRVPMVTVRGLVRALNVLLERNGVRERLIALRGDEEREVYVGLGVAEAIQLAQEGLLEDDDVEGVMDLGAW